MNSTAPIFLFGINLIKSLEIKYIPVLVKKLNLGFSIILLNKLPSSTHVPYGILYSFDDTIKVKSKLFFFMKINNIRIICFY